MLSPKQIGTICFATLFLISPSFATINPNEGTGAGSASCTNSVVETFDGNTSYSANWTPNTIQLSWYVDGAEYENVTDASKSCQYDGAMVIPTQPTKTGYTFMGWTVSGHPETNGGSSGSGGSGGAQQCSLSGLDASINADNDSTHTRWKPISSDGYTMSNTFGEENSSDLNNGEWAVTFSYGIVKGEALCSSTNGTSATAGTPNESGGGQYCWCRATQYTPNGDNQCTVSSSSWLFGGDYWSSDYCASNCASNCAHYVQYNSDFRRSMFGTAQ